MIYYAGKEGSTANRVTYCFGKDNEEHFDNIRDHAVKLHGGIQDLVRRTSYFFDC